MSTLRSLAFACIIVILHAAILHSQWVQTGGLSEASVRCFAVTEAYCFAGAQNGAFRSSDNGENWLPSNNGLTTTSIGEMVVKGTYLFAGTSGGGVFLSTDNGENWAAVNTGLTSSSISAFAIMGPNLFTGSSDGGVFLSANDGVNWTAVNTGLTNLSITALVSGPDGSGGMNLFAGTYGGGVFLSTNNGTSWTAVNTGLTDLNIRALIMKPTESGINLYAGTNVSGVFQSSDNGSRWTKVSTGNVDSRTLCLVESGPCILVGTSGGVFLSTDNGVSWSPFNTGMTDMEVFALAVHDPYLLAGTIGAGVWRRSISDMMTAVPHPGEAIPGEFYLSQNYPNPFNPATTIRFGLPETARVRLAIYDLLGQEVAVLVDGEQVQGMHEIRWEGLDAQNSPVPGGMYVYRLEALSFCGTGKLLLLK